jgi:hypothetical protein
MKVTPPHVIPIGTVFELRYGIVWNVLSQKLVRSGSTSLRRFSLAGSGRAAAAS